MDSPTPGRTEAPGDRAAPDTGLPPVFVSRPLPAAVLSRLEKSAAVEVWNGDGPPSASELRERTRHVVGLLATSADRVDADLLDASPDLAVVSNNAVGYDNVDVAELTRRRIPLGNTPGVLTEATADLAFALVLATTRRLVEARDAILAGQWKTWDPAFMLGMELSGSTLGVVGLGRIGRAVARRAAAFGMNVIAWSRSPQPMDGVELVELDELLARSDVVSLHVSLVSETVHLIGAEQLALMKPTAVLVNTARGAVVDQAALSDALRAGSIGGAGLDVLEQEPIAPDDPLLAFTNCIVLPHIGSATVVTRTRMADLAVDNLLAGVAGERLPACVNPEVYEPPAI
ncbi:MAG: Glyoxylate reductase [Acidimicrobiaceae bacterium]|jgi:glyoxylate reductase|nr:Glyoxylate reductase [Acidimicrobiaceae bacterium]